jgi:hypothetical protein
VPPLHRKTADGGDRLRSSRNASPFAMSNVAYKRIGESSIADKSAHDPLLPVVL